MQVYFDATIASIEYIRAGKLRLLAVSARSEAPPDSPTMSDYKLIADETEKWAKVIRAAGIKAE